ncbi:Dolichyl-phosphate-mannose-protein mannosyltransferase-domain-containing protein [Fimicolochytrium jonesii]|uniref:Dolichyl-phosphate-mannose-protein mannosyltransferase-domain-containing protein n=1 Tax=Fimicolochytrium jonesii TaxID=1396493 RepID=UPI0022FF3B0F|nr:Dolichyl-phosphate-mannose-protein mannosyltransferase-domain-containing protein [Fimicolochytrium jonesii]KAI8818483.1 Dolichyl-phosphate-mannose-protein mannosyltransferase-domain-containing protein [Fimicolochytrium jonesii]
MPNDPSPSDHAVDALTGVHQRKGKGKKDKDASNSNKENNNPVDDSSTTTTASSSPPKAKSAEHSPTRAAAIQHALSHKGNVGVGVARGNGRDSEGWYQAALVVVTLLSFVTRCWGIGYPGQVVFDEVHFGKFASYYLRREYYFDVHPPLGKLLLAGAGWFLGYDGHFLFDNIGDDYVANNVPYVGLRLLPATCGALIVPVVFLTLKELGLSVAGATFGALLLVLDNSLITQSRLILLDSMLTLFCVCSIYAWVKFQQHKHEPFSLRWYGWLLMTGAGLAFTTGVKMVGMLTIAAVGVAVLFDLWELLDYRRGLSMRQFSRHFAARALCLIFFPLAIYLSFFYIHFALLIKSGPGDAFMSPGFQDGLIGSEMSVNSSAIPYFANVTLKHRDTKAFLHSHVDKYPLRYKDNRVSTQGQQVTGYPHRDANNHWIFVPVDVEKYPAAPKYEPTEEEISRNVRYVRHNDFLRLQHARTGSFLVTHDVASPLTPTHMEMTTLIGDVAESRYNETLWRVDVVDGEVGDKVRSKRSHLKLINAHHNVAVHCHKGILPEWGFGQQEVNGNKNQAEKFNIWWIDEVHHERIVDGVEKGEDDAEAAREKEEAAAKASKSKKKLSFLQKFLELQGLMIAHNSGLTKPHPYSSTPITWPFVLRGISFWERKEGLKQIYLLGNPLVWWPAITGTVMYAAMWLIDRLLLRRGIDDFGPRIRNWWDKAPGFLFVCWAMHWIPFFLQGRMLFLHHYLPSFIFSAMVFACIIEFVFLRVAESPAPLGPPVPVPNTATAAIATDTSTHLQQRKPSRGHLAHTLPAPLRRRRATPQGGLTYYAGLAVLVAVAAWGFAYFSPLTYGTGFPDLVQLRRRKWMKSWDLQHA